MIPSGLISHKRLLDVFYEDWEINPILFDIVVPYKKPNLTTRKRKRKHCPRPDEAKQDQEPIVSAVRLKFESEIRKTNTTDLNDDRTSNQDALQFMDMVHSLPYLSSPFNGENQNPHSIECNLGGETYLIPKRSRFFNKNVLEIADYLPLENQFDCIVMDPPWWNKYIRRINAVNEQNGYKMLNSEDIQSIPIERLLSSDGLAIIWCTNSPSHRETLEKSLLPKWQLKLLTIWHWMKVTRRGEPICDFQESGTGKQPYELIFFAVRADADVNDWAGIPKEQMLISVPSVIHSHKFPIFEIIKPMLLKSPKGIDNEQPNCLEIFARYLQPNFTSIGLEVLKLQNVKLFSKKEGKVD